MNKIGKNLISFTRILILTSIFFLPLNGLYYGRDYFGELYVEGSYYFLYVAVVLFMIAVYLERKVVVPKFNGFFVVVLLLIYFTFSGFINLHQITANFFKNRTGVEKILLQFMVLFFCTLCSFMFYNIFSNYTVKHVFKSIRRVIILSFVFILFWGGFEFLQKFTHLNIPFLTYLGDLIHQNPGSYPTRLRFICGEPSWYGVYLSFAFPFVLSLFYPRKQTYLNFFFYYLIAFLSYYTFSRTVGIILIFETFIFILLYGVRTRNLKLALRYFVLLFLPVFIFFNFTSFKLKDTLIKEEKNNLKTVDAKDYKYYEGSNVCRKSMQIAGFKMGLDNPFFGVGLGQFGFNFAEYIPKWALNNVEIVNYMNGDALNWPPVHGLYSRLFAEGGVFALILWVVLWGYLFLAIYKNYLNCSDLEYGSFFIIILISISGFSLLGFNTDSFRFMGYWYTLALGWFLLDFYKDETLENLH